MKKNINPLENIIENDYCIGCGVCASIDKTPYEMKLNKYGKYVAVFNDKTFATEQELEKIKSICPFSDNSLSEDEISGELYSSIDSILHNSSIGYYLKNFAGYVKENDYRDNGSSGGMGSWIASKLLRENYVDAIVHVGATQKEEVLFEYKISTDVSSLNKGSKSRYYPIEMSRVIKFINENDLRYAVVGVPCFIKSIRLLASQNKIFKERVKFTIGLVCGHLKSDYFAKELGWELGINPQELTDINFRKKYNKKSADNYGVIVKGRRNNEIIENESLTRNLFTTNWGHGFFKYNACEYCDDVLAETADITIGDAWLPKYVEDGRGTNIISIRNPVILELFEKFKEELFIEELDKEEIIQSQSSGLRHRREGLAYRLYIKDKEKEWRPQKRTVPSNDISENRKKTYDFRKLIMEKSFEYFNESLEKNNLNIFFEKMKPILKEYKKFSSGPLYIKIIRRVKKILKIS